MNWVGRLISELRRRRVLRMTAFYIIASWLTLQVADLLFPALGIDESALRFVWVAIVAGFPLAVFFSWRYDIGASGITRTPPADDSVSADLALRKQDYVVLLILMGIAVFTLSTMTQQAVEEQSALAVAPETRDIDPHSVAVLPLENLSPETTERYFVSGMYDSLISSLGKVSALQVTSRTSASRVNTSQGIPYVGRKLGVANVVEGAVLREGNQVRISIKLIDTASDQHIWSETYEQPFDDVMAIQASVARAVARVIQARLTVEDEDQLVRSLQIRPETFESYLRAMYRFQTETQDGYREGIEILEAALADDPTSALAYAALAHGYGELGHSLFPVKGAYMRAKAAADKAIELDPTLAEAHLAVAMYKQYYEWDWKAAEASHNRALELNPNLVVAWYQLAWLYELLDRKEEAIAAGIRTIELSPIGPFYVSWLAAQYRHAGEYDKAIELAQSVIELNPKYPVAPYVLGQIYADLGRFDEAIAIHENLAQFRFFAPAVGTTYAMAGQEDKAREVMARYDPIPGNSLVYILIHAALGDADETVEWMKISRDARIPWYPWTVGYVPAVQPLHSDPRIMELAAEIDVPLIPESRSNN